MSRRAGASGRATSIDVARRAGVSVSAVSRAFTPEGRISKAMRERVLRAAAELDYRPNPLARGLITRRSGMVALLMAEVANPFYPAVLETFARALDERGRRVMLFTPARDEPLEALLPQALGYGVEGVVIASAMLTADMARACEAASVPVILFNRTTESALVSAVCCDNEAGGRAVADLFADGGRRRPAFVRGLAHASTSVQRERGFSARLAERGLPEPQTADGHFTFDGGLEAVCRLMQAPEPPDAIFAANDIMALGALDGLRRVLGAAVPDDVWVVGFDDIPAAAWPSFDLTTFRQPINRMVQETLRLLDNPTTGPSTVLLPGRLIERGSCGHRGEGG